MLMHTMTQPLYSLAALPSMLRIQLPSAHEWMIFLLLSARTKEDIRDICVRYLSNVIVFVEEGGIQTHVGVNDYCPDYV